MINPDSWLDEDYPLYVCDAFVKHHTWGDYGLDTSVDEPTFLSATSVEDLLEALAKFRIQNSLTYRGGDYDTVEFGPIRLVLKELPAHNIENLIPLTQAFKDEHERLRLKVLEDERKAAQDVLDKQRKQRESEERLFEELKAKLGK